MVTVRGALPAIATVTVLLATAADPGRAGERAFPATSAMRQVLAGSVEVNRTAAEYRMFDAAEEGAPIEEIVRRAGWRRLAEVSREFITPGGVVGFDGYSRDGAVLLVGVPLCRYGAPAGECEDWVVMVAFARRPVWVDDRGEAPGREPAGWPRLTSSRRILHLAGVGFEAACYRSPVGAAGVMSEARERLGTAGWRVVQVADRGISAAGPDGRESFLFVRDEERGCSFMVVAGGVL